MMKVTLQVLGREMTFTENELTAILEEHYRINETDVKKDEQETAQTPTEGKWFEVNPSSIDQQLFATARKDRKQEATRELILEAFEYLEKNPERNKVFKTLMPEKAWDYKTVGELKKMANKIGDHIADWVEQALEWAQRIANGESWEAICNKADTANWYRLVVWKNGYARLVGGSRLNYNFDPASFVYILDFHDNDNVDDAVPLVVL